MQSASFSHVQTSMLSKLQETIVKTQTALSEIGTLRNSNASIIKLQSIESLDLLKQEVFHLTQSSLSFRKIRVLQLKADNLQASVEHIYKLELKHLDRWLASHSGIN